MASSDVAAASSGVKPRIFFILETPELVDFAGPGPILGISMVTGLCETIHIPLLDIMQFRLQANGFIEGVFVNIKDGECFKVQPHSTLYNGESSFKRMLEALKRNDIYQAPATHEVMLARFANSETITNRATIVAELPPNTYMIGCTFGRGHGVSFGDQIASVGRDTPIAVVVGNVTSGAVANYGLDTTVNVSQYKLTIVACVMKVVIALERKYNVM